MELKKLKKNILLLSKIQIKKNKIFFFNHNHKKFNSYKLINTKFINFLTINGNKQKSEIVFLNLFKQVQKFFLKTAKKIIKFSLKNIMLFIAIRYRKKKKKIINEIPFILPIHLRFSFAIKNIIKIARKKSKTFLINNLKIELINILKSSSELLKYKNELHEYSLKKKSFSHFRWF